MTESDLPVTEMVPGRWGDPQHPVALPEAATAALRHLGVKATAPPATGSSGLAPPALSPDTHAALSAVC